MPDSALFLDRDGVIIENRPNYVRSWADVAIYPQALRALSRLSHWPGKIVIVTNQSAVGRGLVAMGDAEAINQRLVQEIAQAGGRIDAVFMCPHAPADHCDCRKPAPGLLIRASQALSIDLQQSIMIGDALTDVMAARAAGVGVSLMVRTGRGNRQLRLPVAQEVAPFAVYDTLSEALAQLF